MFNKDTFAAMKEGAYFINTARGELVDEDALVEALNSNHLAGAAIDVTVKEPIASDCPLLDAQNLIITPHIAGSSYDVQVCGTRMVAEALEDFIADVKPRNCVVYNK
jgi:phosphoglycerate dehydrogenase-like enzyme